MKKGFTLVELLAVIVILSIISLITVPLIGGVIEDAKKKSMLESANGIVSAARYFAFENDGLYEFKFNESKNGETDSGKKLDYGGSIDGDGTLYIDKEGDISLCIMNDKYYVYKNYDGNPVIGDRTENDYCVIGLDSSKNKYVAKKYDGQDTDSDYTKELIDSKIDELESLNNDNINELSQINDSASSINLDIYALQSDLDTTNQRIDEISNTIKSNSCRLNVLEGKEGC